MPYTTQRSYKPSGGCLYVRLLTRLSKLNFAHFLHIAKNFSSARPNAVQLQGKIYIWS